MNRETTRIALNKVKTEGREIDNGGIGILKAHQLYAAFGLPANQKMLMYMALHIVSSIV